MPAWFARLTSLSSTVLGMASNGSGSILYGVTPLVYLNAKQA